MNCRYLLLQHLHLLTAVTGERSEVRVQHYKAMRSPERFPPLPQLPLVIGQDLCQLCLLYLQMVQAVLKLMDPRSVYRQVLVDLRRQSPQAETRIMSALRDYGP